MRIFSAIGSTVLLVVLGLSAVVTLLAPSLVSVAMITIIGIPIGIYLALAPTLFLVALGAWLFARFFGGGFMPHLAGAVAALILLPVPPHFANARLETSARDLAAADHDDGTTPARRVIAIRLGKLGGAKPAEAPCDGLCQRLLLNDVADRVFYVREDVNQPVSPDTPGVAYSLERRSSCPEVKLEPGRDPVRLDSERGVRNAKRADELMAIEIARGNCLVSEQATLGEAGMVISTGAIKRGKSDISAGLDPFADTLSASRITMHERRDGVYVETFRQTSTTMLRLWHLYMPSVVGGTELRMHSGLIRRKETRGELELTAFLVDRLGLDLALRQEGAESDTRALLASALERSAASVPADLIESFFDGFMRSRTIDAQDRDLAQRLLADPRFGVPRTGWAAVKYAQDAPAGYFGAIGDAMFTRLRKIAEADSGEKYPRWSEQAGHASAIIRQLPRDAILPHRADLEWLARQERIRVPAYGALTRMSEFGGEAAGTLVWLIDDAHRFRGSKGNDWQHPYLAGVIGLCHAGPAANAAVRPFLDRMASGVIVQHGSYWDLNINTLVSLGASVEDIRPVIDLDDRNRSQERFEREVERAGKRLDCSY